VGIGSGRESGGVGLTNFGIRQAPYLRYNFDRPARQRLYLEQHWEGYARMGDTVSLRRVWLVGFWFALLGMVPSFLRLHIETLRILPAVLRSLDASGLPIPDTLAWSSTLVRWISFAGAVTPSLRAAVLVTVYLLLMLIALRVASPLRALSSGSRHYFPRLLALSAIWLGVVLALGWWFTRSPELSLARLLWLCGGVCLFTALWWSADGFAGWWVSASSLRAWSLVRLTLGGLGSGLVGALVLRFTGFDFGAALYRFMFDFPAVFVPPTGAPALADLNPRGWLTFVGISLAIAAVGSFCWASLWTAVVAPAESYHQRVRALAGALVPLALAVVTGVWLFFGVVIGKMDYGRSLIQLREREQIPVGAAGVDTVLLPASAGGVRVARIPFQTIVGFPNEPSVTYKVEQYLTERRFQTTLARPLLIHLHDVRSIDWDPVRSLEVDRLCIENAPRLQFVQLMVETLSNCAVTSEAKRYLDWLDARARPFRQSQNACRIMGDLYARFGEAQKAQQWYERGQIPPGQRKAVAPLGKIVGRVVWNGQPAERVRIGVVAREDSLRFTQARSDRQDVVLVVRPFDWRVVAGVVATDSSGRFEFGGLPYGEYVLLLRVEAQRLPPVPGAAQVEGLPVVVKVDAPTVDVGTIRVQTKDTGVRRPGSVI